VSFDPAAHRLAFRARWAAAVLLLTPLLPYELIDGRPQFLWQLAGELSSAGLLAALAVSGAGLAVMAIGVLAKDASAQAIATLGALLGAALVIKLGAEQSAWEALPLPESLASRPGWAMLALALTASGAYLTFPARTRRLGHSYLVTAVAITAVYYGWPTRGEAPIATVGRALGSLDMLPSWRFKLGFVVMATLALWPALVAMVGLLHVRTPPTDAHPVIGIVALYGLPLLMAMFIFRGVPGSADYGWNLFAAAGAVAVLAAIVSLLASALEVLGGALASDPEAGPRPMPRRALATTVGALVTLGATQALLARPPTKGVRWVLSEATTEGNALYTQALPQWNHARLRWDQEARHRSGAQATLAVRGAGRALVEAAGGIDAALGRAMSTLTRESAGLHVAGRRWYRLVGAVNDAARAAGLPYYLDPTVVTFRGPDGLRRHLDVRTYRIEAVRRYRADGRDFATLHVRNIGGRGLPLLGFSRDLQPFALVATDEIAEFEDTLLSGAAASPPTCDKEPRSDLARPGLERCGTVLAALVEAVSGGLRPAIVALTDRHELQHQIDGPHLVMSGAVLDHLPRHGEQLRERVNRELSAYVAELVTAEAPPKLGLLHLMRFAINAGPGAAEHHVALIALEALTGEPVVDAHGDVNLLEAIAAFDALSRLDDAALRQRAHVAWRNLYGFALAGVVALSE